MALGYVITFDGSESASAVPELIVQKIARPFMGEVRDQYVDVPGRESSWLFVEPPGDAMLDMQCILVGDDNAARRASVRALSSWARSTDRRPLIIDDEPDRFWWAKLQSRPDVDEAVRLGKLALSWRCLPYAEAVATTSHAATGSTTFSVTGDPDIPMYQVIEVTTLAPAASGIELVVNGTTIGTRGALAAGQVRTISALSATITTGANADAELAAGGFVAGSTLDMSTAYGDFDYLLAGSNTITVARGTLGLRVVWRRRYS